jgi:cyclase
MKTIPVTRQILAVTALMFACVAGSRGQGVDFGKQEIETVKLADGVFVLMAGPAQGNILVSAGSDGIFLVDTMYAPMHDKIMAALAKISDKPIRYVVNTHVHGDHTAGNEAMAKLGAVIISHDNMLKRMPAQPAAGLPVLTYSDSMTLHFNGEEIYIYHPAPAHTDGDSIIYFRHANVMQVGDVPASLRFNNIGVNEGGSVDGMIVAGEQVMKIANENTKIVPGHLGPVIGFKEIQLQLVMFRAVRDRVLSAIRAGKTMEEVVASKPTADFDPGRTGGAITNDRVCAAGQYGSVAQKLKQQRAHKFRLLLLHPVAGAIEKMESDHLRAGALAHPVHRTRRLIDAPIAFPGDELRGHVYGAA